MKKKRKNENSIFPKKEEPYKEYSAGNNSIKTFISKHKVLIIIGSIILLILFVYFMIYVEENNRQKEIEKIKNELHNSAENLKEIDDELECAEEIERKMDENGNINYYSVSRECRYLIDRFTK